MRRRIHNGFTLIEIMISLSILVVGLVALLALFISSFDVAMKATNLTEATLLAQQKMEEIKKAGYPKVSESWTDFSNPMYSYQVVAVPDPPAATDTYQTITLTVRWSYRGKLYSENFIYYLAKFSP